MTGPQAMTARSETQVFAVDEAVCWMRGISGREGWLFMLPPGSSDGRGMYDDGGGERSGAEEVRYNNSKSQN